MKTAEAKHRTANSERGTLNAERDCNPMFDVRCPVFDVFFIVKTRVLGAKMPGVYFVLPDPEIVDVENHIPL